MVGHSFWRTAYFTRGRARQQRASRDHFGAAAASWKNSSGVRERLLAAVRKDE